MGVEGLLPLRAVEHRRHRAAHVRARDIAQIVLAGRRLGSGRRPLGHPSQILDDLGEIPGRQSHLTVLVDKALGIDDMDEHQCARVGRTLDIITPGSVLLVRVCGRIIIGVPVAIVLGLVAGRALMLDGVSLRSRRVLSGTTACESDQRRRDHGGRCLDAAAEEAGIHKVAPAIGMPILADHRQHRGSGVAGPTPRSQSAPGRGASRPERQMHPRAGLGVDDARARSRASSVQL